MSVNYQANVIRADVAATIANGAALSDTVELKGLAPVGIQTDSAWDTQLISIAGSTDGTTFLPVLNLDTGAEWQTPATIAASKYVPIDCRNFLGLRYLQVRSGISSASAAQSGATVVTVSLREL
jgi:hypothetical protein